MIGVAARSADAAAVVEFFELFKTPWEWLVPGKRYDVVLSADGCTEARAAALALVYSATEHPMDRRLGISAEVAFGSTVARWNDVDLPLYGSVATLGGQASGGVLSTDNRTVDCRTEIEGTTVRRIGYDLFREISLLLSQGQPKSHAHIPTLELHIEFLRQCFHESGIAYLEVPARPYRADFVCCLTHDIDFFGIRRHATALTVVGFIVRATVGTFFDLLTGRRPLGEAIRNWLAVLSLPLVFAGLKPDIWDPFRDYAKADRGHPSTFFLVPFRNRPGTAPDGKVKSWRSVAYGIRDVWADLKAARTPQVEFAVHGIDAWRDGEAGREEKAELTAVTGQQKTGVRMHWLYFSDESGRHLEAGGFDYDATWGYNDAIGFRAGTAQVFSLPGGRDVLELPLAIMDTALFYRDRMGLTRAKAGAWCSAIVTELRRFGGALVINWHDRSLVPERQWSVSYNKLLDDVERGSVWFATAGQAVDWFRWRRSIRFIADDTASRVTVQAPELPDGLPMASLVLRHGTPVEEAFRGEPRTVSVSVNQQAIALSR